MSSKQALPANCMISIYMRDYDVTQCPSILLHILLREMTVLRGTLSCMTSHHFPQFGYFSLVSILTGIEEQWTLQNSG